MNTTITEQGDIFAGGKPQEFRDFGRKGVVLD